MDTVLVVNAGSSSVKFQVFAIGVASDLKCLVKGQMDGIGTRPRLRAEARDKQPLCVPKIKFCNIGGEGHRELGVT